MQQSPKTRLEAECPAKDSELLPRDSSRYELEVRNAILLYGKDTLQMGEVESALLSYEKTRRKVEDNSASALVTYSQNQRGRNTFKGSSSRGRSKSKNCEKKVQSNKCKEWGHTKRDCPTWDKKDSQDLESSMAIAENTEDHGDILTIFMEDTYS